MSFFDDLVKSLERVIGRYRNAKTAPLLTQEKLADIIKIQQSGLTNIQHVFGLISDKELVQVVDKYMKVRFDPRNKNSVAGVLPYIHKHLTGRAATMETKLPFSSAIFSAQRLLEVTKDIEKHLDTFVDKEGITLDKTKLTVVMLLGVLQDIDTFIDYVNYLWSHVTRAVTGTSLYPIAYQAKFLNTMSARYCALVSAICDSKGAYTFLRDIDALRKKNVDLILYGAGDTALNLLSRVGYTKYDQDHIQKGIIGFNIVGHILEYMDVWRHDTYIKERNMRALLEDEIALLRYDLMGVDPNSREYANLVKRIELREQEIARLDRKIKEYEEGD